MQNQDKPLPHLGLAFCLLGRAESVLLARGAGFDFALVDMEHGPLGLDALAQVAAAGLAAGFPVWARVGGPASPDLARALDCGATGVVVPHVDSPTEARAIAAACRFAPAGRRALPGPLPGLDYGLVPAKELCARAGEQTRVIAMIESAAGLAAAEQIAAVDGIDMLLIGANDLADSLGRRGALDHPEVRQAFETVAMAARRHGCGFGTMGLPPDLIESHALSLGAEAIVVTNETNLIIAGGAAAIARIRAGS